MDCYVSWSHNLNPNTPTIAFFSRGQIEPGTELTFDYKADVYNMNEMKGIPNVVAEDDEFFFNGNPALRYHPNEGKNGHVSNDENEEFLLRRGKRTRKPGPRGTATFQRRRPKSAPRGSQHHLTSEFHQKCFCGSEKCRIYLS